MEAARTSQGLESCTGRINMFNSICSNSNASNALSNCIKRVDTGTPTSLHRAKVSQKLARVLSTIEKHGIVSMLLEVPLRVKNVHQYLVCRRFRADVGDHVPLSASVGHCIGNSLQVFSESAPASRAS